MVLNSSDFKEIARVSLAGHWLKSIAACFLAAFFGVFSLSFFAFIRSAIAITLAIWFLEYIPNYFIILLSAACMIALFQFFFGGTVHLGYIKYNLSLLDRADIRIGTLFSCFHLFWKAFLLRVYLLAIDLLGTLLFIIPGIFVHYTYAMAPYVLEERPGFPIIEAMRNSRKMMQGNKLKLFRLRLSFIGWDLLCFLTLGIAAIYVLPLKNAAEAVFYNEISGRADVYYAREELS